MLFAASSTPRLFGLSPGADLGQAVADGLIARLEADTLNETLARTTLIVNAHRTGRAVTEALIAGGAILLPRVVAIAEIDKDRLTPPLPEAADTSLGQRFKLMQAVASLQATMPGSVPTEAAFALAGSLATLLDEMQAEGVAFDDLRGLDVAAVAGHWQMTLAFLGLLQGFLADDSSMPSDGSDARLRHAVDALLQRWQTAPPTDPVLIVGSTGSRGPMADLIGAVARLPQGAVLLPGFDTELDAASWAEIAETPEAQDHPQSVFARLLARIDADLSHVQNWVEEPKPSARARLLSLALRPAPVTDGWRRDGPGLVSELPDALSGLSLLEAAQEREEADAIALALRHAAGAGQTAMLITPDGAIARRVTATLARWDIVPDDSAGRPLSVTPPGSLLGLILDAAGGPIPTAIFLALLKHPLTASGEARGPHMLRTRSLERDLLRGAAPVVDWATLIAWAGQDREVLAWVMGLKTALEPLEGWSDGALAAHLAHHRRSAEALVSGDGGDHGSADALWDMAAGAASNALFEELGAEGNSAGSLTLADYRSVFFAVMSGKKARAEDYLPDPRIRIRGAMEARAETADLVILAGLNEGVWPAAPDPDPWLNRALRRQAGLPSPDKTTGLAAHDFQIAANGRSVILARSLKSDGAPTVASRWLTRIENLVTGLGLEAAGHWGDVRARGMAWAARAGALDQPKETKTPAARPCPAPPLEARPRQLSVTQVETLARDPYAFYARHVLGLRPMDPPGRDATALDRGVALHRVIERFTDATREALPEDAEALLLSVAETYLLTNVPWSAKARFWLGRVARFAPDFVADEAARRALAKPLIWEDKGAIEIEGFDPPVVLTAKPDRIDRDAHGRALIYDYKSSIPSAEQIKVFAPQMPLEALMVERGGFERLGRAEVASASLIALSRPTKGQRVAEVDVSSDALALAWPRFKGLLERMLDPALGFPAALAPFQHAERGDYDQLARRGEWVDGAPYTPDPVG